MFPHPPSPLSNQTRERFGALTLSAQRGRCYGGSSTRKIRRSRVFVLLAFQAIEKRGRQFVLQFQENAVRPAKPNHILAVALHDMSDGGALDDVVLFADVLVGHKILNHHTQKTIGDAIGFRSVTVAAHTVYRK